ncbi:MAG: hypothetical protein ACK47B_26510 [Armatimonadota bacterium]
MPEPNALVQVVARGCAGDVLAPELIRDGKKMTIKATPVPKPN